MVYREQDMYIKLIGFFFFQIKLVDSLSGQYISLSLIQTNKLKTFFILIHWRLLLYTQQYISLYTTSSLLFILYKHAKKCIIVQQLRNSYRVWYYMVQYIAHYMEKYLIWCKLFLKQISAGEKTFQILLLSLFCVTPL